MEVKTFEQMTTAERLEHSTRALARNRGFSEEVADMLAEFSQAFPEWSVFSRDGEWHARAVPLPTYLRGDYRAPELSAHDLTELRPLVAGADEQRTKALVVGDSQWRARWSHLGLGTGSSRA